MNGSQNTYLNGLVAEIAPLLALAGDTLAERDLRSGCKVSIKEKILMALTKCDFCTNPNNQKVKSGELQPWSDYGCSTDNCGKALQLMMEYTRLTCAPHSKEVTVNKNYNHNSNGKSRK